MNPPVDQSTGRPARARRARSLFADDDCYNTQRRTSYSACGKRARSAPSCTTRAVPTAKMCGQPALPGTETCEYHRPKKLSGQPIPFPDTPTTATLRAICGEWYDNFNDSRWTQVACAACAALHNSDEVTVVHLAALETGWLEPLRVPPDFLPFLNQSQPAHRNDLFSFGDPLCDQHLVEEAGLLRDESTLIIGARFCKSCKDSLSKGKVPVSSLANGLWCGPVPEELRVLTAAEEIVIGLARSSYNALFFLKAPISGGPDDTRQRASRGHWVAYPQHVDRVHQAVNSLPHPAKELADVLHVTLVGPVSAESRTLKKALAVSIKRVKAAFDWLKTHNELYAGIVWDEAAASTYGEEEDVPSEIVRHVWPDADDVEERETYGTADGGTAARVPVDPSTERATADALNEALSAGSGSSSEDSEDDLNSEEGSQTLWDEDNDWPDPDLERRRTETAELAAAEAGWAEVLPDEIDGEVSTSGVVDVSGRRIPLLDRQSAAVGRILARKNAPHVSLPRAAVLESAFDADYLPRVFPKLYPYGVGGAVVYKGAGDPSSASGSGPDLLKHLRGQLLAADKRFALHRTFLFFAFDLHQRRQILQRSALKVGQAASRAEELLQIQVEDLHALQAAIAGRGRSQEPSDGLKRAELLLKHCQWVLGDVVGSQQSRRNSRNHIRALITAYGMPGVWFTVSPADQFSVLLLKLAGHRDVRLDLGAGQTFPSLEEQQRLIADNPVAVALFFKAILDAVLLIVFGTSRDASRTGVFGRAVAHYATIESSKRGYLHAHGLLFLHGQPSPEHLEHRLKDPSYRDRICEYVDRVFRQDFGHARDWVADRRANGIAVDNAAVLMDLPAATVDDTDNKWIETMEDDRRAVGERTLVHSCGRHCEVRGKCRYRYPKALVQDTHVTDEGVVVPRRRNERVNGHNPTVVNLTRCNSDVKLTFLVPAMLLSFIFYATKYMTKSDLKTSRTTMFLEMSKKTNDAYANDQLPRTQQARALLARCCRAIKADAELPAAAVAYYILFNQDHFSSDRFVSLKFAVALARLFREARERQGEPVLRSSEAETADEGADNDGDRAIADSEEHPSDELNRRDGPQERMDVAVDEETDEVVEYNAVEDYVHRGEELEAVPFYLFVAKFKVERIAVPRASRRAGRRYRFLPSHPRAATTWAVERELPSVPVLEGPSIPSRDHPNPDVLERYAQGIMVLFKPWRTVEDLVPNGSTYREALAIYQPDAECLPYIDHLQLLHSMKADGEKMRAAHESLGTLSRLARDGRDAEGNADREGGADGGLVADAVTIAEVMMKAPSSGDAWLNGGIKVLANQGVIDPRILDKPWSPARTRDGDADASDVQAQVVTWDARSAKNLQLWKAALKDQDDAVTLRRRAFRRSTTAAEQQVHATTSNPKEMTNVPGTVDIHAAAVTARAFDLDDDTNPVKFGIASGLNQKQMAAFVSICLAQLDQELGRPAVQIFISGAAGSGKSKVLNTVASWMAARNRTGQLRLAASTGTAAAKIKGMTLHSLVGITKLSNSNTDGEVDALSVEKRPNSWAPKKPKKRTHDELANVTLVLADEVGMIGHGLMNATHSTMMAVKANDQAFGGIVVAWFGDFCQFSPVGDTALFDIPKFTSPPTLNLWQSEVTTVIILDEPMRQDPAEVAFLQTLSNLRVGESRDESYALLNKRVVGSAAGQVSLRTPLFKDAVFITPRHSLRRRVNELRSAGMARDLGQHLFASVAKYFGSTPPVETLEKVREKSPSAHGSCDPVVYLTIGMRVVINTNVFTSQGITNGAYGKVTRIVLDPFDADRLPDAPIDRPFILKSPPRMVVVALEDVHPHLATLDGLNAGEVPIVPLKGAVKVDKTSISFEQVPISPAFAITDYRAQGATERAVIVDFTPPGRTKHDAAKKSPLKSARSAVYVCSSRVTTLGGLAVVRKFSTADLGTVIEPRLRAELKREAKLQEETVKRLQQRLEDEGWFGTYSRYILSAQAPSGRARYRSTFHG